MKLMLRTDDALCALIPLAFRREGAVSPRDPGGATARECCDRLARSGGGLLCNVMTRYGRCGRIHMFLCVDVRMPYRGPDACSVLY